MNNVLFAFLLTLIAGLSTGIGSFIAFFTKRTNTKFLSISLGFSAGVMIYISMIELFPEARDTLARSFGDKTAMMITIISFFGGIALLALIDKLIPSDKNPHEVKLVEDINSNNISKSKLLRTGLFTALVISIHNFPEGISTFMSALEAPNIAIPVVIAIAIHNIPEGIAVSIPIYYATGEKKKAFIYSFASGFSEPLGAIIAYTLLRPILNENVKGIMFAIIAGIMMFISFDELLPVAREYGEHHLSIYGLIFGMLVMAISLWLFI